MKALLAACAAVLTLGVANAKEAAQPAAEAEAASPYQVIREDVSIPFAQRTVIGFHQGLDDSIILKVIGQHYYRADIDSVCRRDLRYDFSVGMRTFSGSLHRGDRLIIERRPCFINRIDEIADPRPVEAAAREAERRGED